MASPAESSKTTRLQLLARPLRPARPPFYVQHATITTPMMGWWWEPQPGSLQPLGASYEMAIVAIATLNGQEAHAA